MTQELWRPVVGSPNYQVSSLGRIKSPQGRVLSQRISSGGFALQVTILIGGRRVPKSVHRLVSEAYLGPLPGGLETCHNDGNFKNNAAENLRYDTRANNERDKKQHGTANVGSQNGRAKLTEAVARAIRATRGLSGTQIAAQFGISRQTVREIQLGVKWRHA